MLCIYQRHRAFGPGERREPARSSPADPATRPGPAEHEGQQTGTQRSSASAGGAVSSAVGALRATLF